MQFHFYSLSLELFGKEGSLDSPRCLMKAKRYNRAANTRMGIGCPLFRQFALLYFFNLIFLRAKAHLDEFIELDVWVLAVQALEKVTRLTERNALQRA